ncbi:hypothetical protein PHMEG_00028021, partial [Phytophthora megakarya]
MMIRLTSVMVIKLTKMNVIATVVQETRCKCTTSSSARPSTSWPRSSGLMWTRRTLVPSSRSLSSVVI